MNRMRMCVAVWAVMLLLCNVSWADTSDKVAEKQVIQSALAGGGRFYVKIKGHKQGAFKGESLSKARRDWITGLGFSLEVGTPRDTTTGLPIGRKHYNPVVITKEWGAATPQILSALATNEILDSVQIEFVKVNSAGNEYVYQRITLTNATISAVRQSAGREVPPSYIGIDAVEAVSFTFQRIEVENLDGKTLFADDWNVNG